eukprot:g4347.t1
MVMDTNFLRGTIPLLAPRETWGFSFEELSKIDLSGKVALVTGANVGLGFETAKHLAMNGAKTLLACRSMEKCSAAKQRIGLENAVCIHVDLSSMESVRTFVAEVREAFAPIDILILNAGVMHAPYTLTKDGLELHFQVNHLSHHYIATRLELATGASVVSVSSNLHFLPPAGGVKLSEERLKDKAEYNSFLYYGQSKLANVLFAKEMQKRHTELFVNAVHPGAVFTDLTRHWTMRLPSLFKSVFEYCYQFLAFDAETASLTQLFAALLADQKGLRGEFLVPIARVSESSAWANNASLAHALWDFSESIIDRLEG